jgi:hypothetical protein
MNLIFCKCTEELFWRVLDCGLDELHVRNIRLFDEPQGKLFILCTARCALESRK